MSGGTIRGSGLVDDLLGNFRTLCPDISTVDDAGCYRTLLRANVFHGLCHTGSFYFMVELLSIPEHLDASAKHPRTLGESANTYRVWTLTTSEVIANSALGGFTNDAVATCIGSAARAEEGIWNRTECEIAGGFRGRGDRFAEPWCRPNLNHVTADGGRRSTGVRPARVLEERQRTCARSA